MKVGIWSIKSVLHDPEVINTATNKLITELTNLTGYEYEEKELDDFYNCDLSLILISSGGSENLFLQNLDKLKAPYYLLTLASNNSLAASIEILAYINNNHQKGEILHGTSEYIASRITQLIKESKNG